MGVWSLRLVKSARARADADPMPGQDTQTASMDDLLDDEGGAHPQPSEAAGEIAAEFGERLNADLAAGGVAPSPGEPIYPPGFNPSIHAWPPDKTARGTWRRRKPTDAPPPAHTHTPPIDVGAGVDAAQSAQVPGASPQEKAENWLGRGLGVCKMVLGEQWTPSEIEFQELKDALAKFLAAHNLPDLPPGWGLLLAASAFALPRVLAMPRVKTHVDKLMSQMGLAGDAPQVPAQDTQTSEVKCSDSD